MTHGLRVSPFSTAFFASSAAPIITDGLDVLVQRRDRGDDDGAVVELDLLPSIVVVTGLLGRPPSVGALAECGLPLPPS